MMNWSHACSVQSGREDLQSAVYGGFSVPLILHTLLAVYSGFWLWKWKKDIAEMSEVWPALGRFCSLTLICSLSGAAASALGMKYQLVFHDKTENPESSFVWLGYFIIFSAIEFLSSTVAKLMLLHQLRADTPRSSLATAFPRVARALPLLVIIVAAVASISSGITFVASMISANYSFNHYASYYEDDSHAVPYTVAYYSRSVASVVIAAAFVLIGAWCIFSNLRAERKGQQGLLKASKLPYAVAVLHLTLASRSGWDGSPRAQHHSQPNSNGDGRGSKLHRCG
jgi:hypothetical protein